MNASLRLEPNELHRRIERALKYGPRTSQQLLDELDVSQPTLSRTIRDLSSKVTMFRVKGRRTPYYGLLRTLPFGMNARQRIFRILSSGNIVQFADMEFLEGGGTLERTDTAYFYEGLPPYMTFAAPSGFLGRQRAHGMRDALFKL